MDKTRPAECDVSQVDVARALRRLGTLLQGRVSLLRAMTVVARDTDNPTLAATLASVRQELENGARLASAFSDCPFMSAVVLELLASAEEQGALDTQLPLIADYLLEDAALEAKAAEAASDQGRFVFRGVEVGLAPQWQDLPVLCRRWFVDPEVALYCGMRTAAALDRLLCAAENPSEGQHTRLFAVQHLASQRLIGISWLMEVDHRNRTAELGVLIGEASQRGKGYGTEAVRLTLDLAFNANGLNSVIAVVPEFNTAGLRTAQKAGFREFGRRRQSFPAAGRLWDLVYMECLAEEFESPVLKRAFPMRTA
ncbi:MAG: GNAT family N-acetyltransferase [Armatimonadota bacterium]